MAMALTAVALDHCRQPPEWSVVYMPDLVEWSQWVEVPFQATMRRRTSLYPGLSDDDQALAIAATPARILSSGLVASRQAGLAGLACPPRVFPPLAVGLAASRDGGTEPPFLRHT